MRKLHICKIILSFVMVSFTPFEQCLNMMVILYITCALCFSASRSEDSYLVVRIPSILTAFFTAAMK